MTRVKWADAELCHEYGQKSYFFVAPDNGTPAISVIVPLYNRIDYLEEALESLHAQSIGDLEIIVVNDGSDDPDAIAVLEALRADQRITIIDIPHRGWAGARNAGVAAASAGYVFFLDCHDLLQPTALEKSLLLAALHPHVAFFYTGMLHFGAANAPTIIDVDRELPVSESFLTCSVLIRRDLFTSLGGCDEAAAGNHEDGDFWRHLIASGHGGMLLAEPLLYHRRHNEELLHVAQVSRDEIAYRLRSRYPSLYGESSGNRFDQRHKAIPKQDPSTIVADMHAKCFLAPIFPWPFSTRHWQDTRIHILYLVPFCPIGGAERVDLDILAGLPKDRYHVTLVLAYHHAHDWLDEFGALVDEIFFLPHFSTSDNGRDALLVYLIISRDIDIVFNRNTPDGYRLSGKIKKISENISVVDLLHTHDHGRDWVGIAAEFHYNLDARVVSTGNLLDYSVRTYSLPGEDFTLIYNSVDPAKGLTAEQAQRAGQELRSELGIASDAWVLGFAGRLSEEKGPLRWLEVAAVIATKSPSVRFVMVGIGPLMPDVESAVIALGLSGRVHLLGYQRDIDRCYAAMTVLLMTSRFEGLPMVMLEAMLQGLPVVATDVGAIGECVNETVGRLVPSDAVPAEIAEAVLEVFDRSQSDSALGAKCRQRVVEKFDLGKMQESYRALFEGLCLRYDRSRRRADYRALEASWRRPGAVRELAAEAES